MQHLAEGTELEGNTRNMQKNWEKEQNISQMIHISENKH